MATAQDGKLFKRDFNITKEKSEKSNSKKEKDTVNIFVAKSKTDDKYWDDYDYAWCFNINEATRIFDDAEDYQWYLDCGKFDLVKVEK